MRLVVSLRMANTKPYVQVASVCERVIQESDGVISAIRLVDTLTVQTIAIPKSPEAPQEGHPVNAVQLFDLHVLVMLKAGELAGDFRIALQMRDPKGKVVRLPVDAPVVFKGGDGVNLNFKFGLPNNGPEGQYWFDVLWSGEILTSIPLMLKRAAESVVEVSPTKH